MRWLPLTLDISGFTCQMAFVNSHGIPHSDSPGFANSISTTASSILSSDATTDSRLYSKEINVPNYGPNYKKAQDEQQDEFSSDRLIENPRGYKIISTSIYTC